MILLCISDVHGNLDALRAVLATAERRAFHKLLVAGDLVFPGPEPLETWRRLTAAGALMVQGMSDRAVATLDPDSVKPRSDHEKARLDRMRTTREALGELILQRLRKLPTHKRIPLEDGGELLLVHGSPADPAEPLTHDMSDDEVNALLGDDPADGISRTWQAVTTARSPQPARARPAVRPSARRRRRAGWTRSTSRGRSASRHPGPRRRCRR